MILTVEKLAERGARREWIEAFARAFPNGLDVAGWPAECQIGMLMHEELRWYLGWFWALGVLPQWSMSKWDLSGARLRGACLAGANLTRANLFGADLEGADLAGANLSGAYLAGVNLARANLSGVNLASASLRRADLPHANLMGVNLAGADLTAADLAGARWDDRPPPAGWSYFEGRLWGTPDSGPTHEGRARARVA